MTLTWRKEECSADKNLYEAYLGYKEARDTLNQVRRGRGFWPVIAIPSPDVRSATLAVRANDESFRVKGKDSKGTTHKGKSKGHKSGKSGKNKGGKGKSSGKSNVKGKGDPLKQRLVSRTQCRMCGEEGHWEEDCPQAFVDMPQAKRLVTFARPPVGVGVSQAWGVETWNFGLWCCIALYWRGGSCSHSSGHHRVWRNTSSRSSRQNSTFQVLVVMVILWKRRLL